MKVPFVLLIWILSLSLVAQEDVSLTPQPWNGDWLQTRLDQMVNGENFRGWPGPLPKLWTALGVDTQHPSVDYELQERVIREAPTWFGTCNGWAAAAIQFPQPESVVVNGVKLFSSELRAYLAYIWKDNIVNRLGDYDENGITALAFDQVLSDYVAKNIPIIFDVDSGSETWNYPASGFTRTKTANGTWTNVTVDMRYIDTLPLRFIDKANPQSRRLLRETYTYRYNNEGHYEWTGASVTNRPQSAWFSETPFWGTWRTRGNRHLNMALYNRLLQIGSPTFSDDIYEPNDNTGLAYPIYGNLTMGSLDYRDLDYYQFEKRLGEPFDLRFNAYDGACVDVEILDAQGTVMEVHPGICELNIQLPDYEGSFFVKLHGLQEGETSFYELKSALDRPYFRLPAESPYIDGTLTATVIRGTDATVVTDELVSVPLNGAVTHEGIEGRAIYRGTDRVVWTAEQRDEDRISKTYALDHPLVMPYVIPHLTCRNGWKTELHLFPENSRAIQIEVYSAQGVLLEQVRVPNQRVIDLGSLIPSAATTGAWIQLKTSAWNVLNGWVRYRHDGIGYQADFDIQSRPRNGEMVVHDLPLDQNSWVGLAIVNTSGVYNPIQYRVLDENADIVESGAFDLQPGEKWQGLPRDLIHTTLGPKHTFWFFSQFNVETLALRHDAVHQADYAHRLYNPILDFHTETVVTLPKVGVNTQSFFIGGLTQGATFITFRAYDANGNSLFNHRFGPLRDFQTRHITLEELLREANVDPASHGISHFKLTSSQPLLAYELNGVPGSTRKTHTPFVKIYDKK